MATLSPAQIRDLALGAGFNASEAVTATAIALAESGGRTDAQGDTGITTAVWGPSVGLWQIRSLKSDSGTGRTRDATRLTDPKFNAQSARAIYKASGWSPWSVYKSGAYRAHLSKVPTSGTGDPIPTTDTDSDKTKDETTAANGNPILQALGLPDFGLIMHEVARLNANIITALLALTLFAIGMFLIFRERAVPVATEAVAAVATKGKSLVASGAVSGAAKAAPPTPAPSKIKIAIEKGTLTANSDALDVSGLLGGTK